jgi:streptogramin lyase
MDRSTRTALRRLPRRVLTVAATTVLLLAAGLSTATAAPTRSEVPLPDGLQPEGITSGPGTTYYVGSLADGRIVTGDLKRGSSSVLLPGAAGRQLRGLYWDSRSNLVWAVGNVGAEAHVYAVNAGNGAIVRDLVVPGGGFLNDLVVTRDAVWVTDSFVDRLTVIRLGCKGLPTSGSLAFVPLSGAWPAGDGAAINANGIRALPDGSLVLNNSRVGGLWRVDPRTGATTEIPVTGGPPIVSGDGLELVGTTLYNVRGTAPTEVAVVMLHRSHGTWTARWQRALTDPRLDVPSTATFAAGALWAVNARFGIPSPDTAPYWVTRLRAH